MRDKLREIGEIVLNTLIGLIILYGIYLMGYYKGKWTGYKTCRAQTYKLESLNTQARSTVNKASILFWDIQDTLENCKNIILDRKDLRVKNKNICGACHAEN